MSPYKVRGFQFMFRKRLVASVAAAPLLLFASQALAEVTITDKRTTAVTTATINSGAADSIVVASGGSVVVTATGPAVTINSNNTVTNKGEISSKDVDGSIGIQVNGGVTTTLTNTGAINIIDSYAAKDDGTGSPTSTAGDGNLDGAFATGSGRYGIRVSGAGAVTGDILNDTGGAVTVEGNNSWGISLESALIGDFTNLGSVSIVGDDTYGIQITGPVTGDVTTSGIVSATGKNAVGVAVDANVSGALQVQGTVTATGYRYSSRPPSPTARADLDADDLLQGGPAYRISGDIAGGVMMAVAPTADTDNDNDGWVDTADTDDDNDGVLDTDDKDDDGDGITDNDYDDDGTINANDSDDDGDGIADADDDDDDGDGVLDGDTDGDGVVDSAEGAANISVAGAAPGVLIGSDTRAITIGAVGAGSLNYGLVLDGNVSATGVYDDIAATAIKIGGSAGFATVLTNGVAINGSVSAVAYNGNVQALHLASGANVPTINVTGSVYAGMSTTSAPLASEDSLTVYGIRIDAGATSTALVNSGAISTFISGEKGRAVSVWDGSGLLNSVVNTGSISSLISANDDVDDTDDADTDASNETIAAQAIAIDLSSNTTGVTLVQYSVTGDTDGDGVLDVNDNDVDGDGIVNGSDTDDDNDGILDVDDTTNDLDVDGDGVADGQEASITGGILLGSGADTIDLQNGIIAGDIAFGAGADRLTVGTGAWVAGFAGEITDSDGQLALNLVNGTMQLDNLGVLDATSLTVSGNGTLIISADPVADAATQITVATANIADGAQLGLRMTGLITSPTERYTIIKTDTPAGLTIGVIDNTLLGNAPYLVVAEASANTALGEVYLDIRRRTVAEMALTGNQALALDAVYEALSGDEAVMNAFLGATTRDEFLSLYEQMLPDQGEGLFSAIGSLTSTISRLTATKPDPRERYGPDSFWMQEINVEVMRDAGVALGSETKAFGFVGGYESMGADGGALGATLAFISAEEKDDVAAIGEETTISLLEAGVYWRRSVGSWLFSARGSGGYAWFDGDRVFISPTDSLIRQADSGWSGFTGLASLSASYQADVGRFFIRPLVSLDYLYLSEGSRQESGGEDAFNLFIKGRTSTRLSGNAEVAFGATLGRELWWRPEVRLGYRQYLAGEMGDTVFRFKNGQLVALPPSELGDNAVVLGLSLKAGTPMSYVAIEGEYEATDGEDRYNLQLAGRMMF